MSWINFDDVRLQLLGAGLVLDKDLDYTGRIQRWKVEGEDQERRGWSRLREWRSTSGNLYIVGSYGVWHGTDDGYTKVELPKRDDPQRPVLSEDDIKAMRAAQKEAAKKIAETRKAEAKQAARWAAQVWAFCQPALEHEYLQRKGIEAHGARIFPGTDAERLVLPGLDDSNHWRLGQAAGALVVPMHDEHGNVVGIQFIYPKGHKRAEKVGKEFWPTGMAMGGSFGVLGPMQRNGIMCIAEGFATAASIHEATGLSVAYAFAANNLLKAAREIRKTCKASRILFCADDDYLSDGNPGLSSAAQAVAEVENSDWTYPDFKDEAGNDLRGGKKLTDYNDLAVLTSPVKVSAQINARIDALKWREPILARVDSPVQGEGEKHKGRRRAESVMPLDDIVARFLPIDDGTGKYVFDTWTNKIAHKDQVIALLPSGVRGDDIKRHPVWQSRGAYYLDQVGFDPSGNDSDVALNTWQGWPMKPKQGCCDRLLELIEYLCSNEDDVAKRREVFDWLLCWMAYPLQNPGAKMSSAVIMHGPQGTGKSTVFQVLAKIYGQYSTVLNQRGIEDKFNADWADSKLFILAEEVVTRAEMWHIKNELKELVSGERIRVNPKNIAAYYQKNHINIAYLSNEHQPLPLENDDRRHLVIYTPPQVGPEYYDEVFIEIEQGGVEAFYWHLMNLDLSKFHPKKRPPMTEAKARLIELSSPSEIRFLHEWIAGDLGLPVCPCLASDCYAAYLRWCRQNGEGRPRASNQFFGALGHQVGWLKKKVKVFETPSTVVDAAKPIVFPPESALDEAQRRQPGQTEGRWASNGLQAFSEALNKHAERYGT